MAVRTERTLPSQKTEAVTLSALKNRAYRYLFDQLLLDR